MLVEFSVVPCAVQKEYPAGLDVLYHLVEVDVSFVVAGNKVSLLDVIGRFDRLVAKAQVGDRYAAGLLGVVLEVRLYLLVGVVADDLDAVLVGSDCSIGSETPELAGLGAFRSGVGIVGRSDGKSGHIVVDGDGELGLRALARHVLEYGQDVSGLYVLGTETVAASGVLAGLELASLQGSDYVKVERLAYASGLFGPVEDSDPLDGLRHHGEQVFGGERSVEVDLNDTDLLAGSDHVVDQLFCGVADGTHGKDHVLGVRSAVVIEGLVVGSDLLVHHVHVFGDDVGSLVVCSVGSLSVLEVGFRLLGRSHQSGVGGMEHSLLEGFDGVPVYHGGELVIVPHLDLLVLVRCTETVKEVEHGELSADGGEMRYSREVHYLLYAVGCQHSETGLAHCHDVRLISEDRQGVGSQSSSGYMEYRRSMLAGDFVHVRDHQKKSLGSGERGGVGTCGYRSVHSTGSAAFRLKFDDLYFFAEDVLSVFGSPFVHALSHGR